MTGTEIVALLRVLQSNMGPERPGRDEPEDRQKWDQIEAACATLASTDTPMQPTEIAKDGVLRFKENRIVSRLLEVADGHGYGLNEVGRGDFTDEERRQLAQLIGYSVSGYETLSYASPTRSGDARRAMTRTGTYGCACPARDAHACILIRYRCDCGDPSERCECPCHQQEDVDDAHA